MMRKTDNRIRKGFTLVELLVVIIILSMLAAIVGPQVFKQVGKAKVDLVKPMMADIESAINAFYLNTGVYPSNLDELINCPSGYESTWAGPYLKTKQLKDPWGNAFDYNPNGTINPGSFDLISYGADGSQGGEGEYADIYND